MKSYEDIYFSILDGDAIDEERLELVSAAVVEYRVFSIVSSSEHLLVDIAQRVHASTEIRPACILVSGGALLATVENIISFAYPCDNVSRRFIKFNLNDASTEEVMQISYSGLTIDIENRVRYSFGLEQAHPVIRNLIETACAQQNELASIVSQLLIGYSFLSESILRKKSADSDLDGLQLQELEAFITYLKSVSQGFYRISNKVSSILSYCASLLSVRPSSAADLSNSQPNAALQNGFPCVYKVMSVFHYLGYELAMQRRLYNKAFMHIFRAYECYSSGALFLHNARISDLTTKKGTMQDVYVIGNNVKVRGFGQVFNELGSYFNLSGDKYYQICRAYLELRNRFHYTHGDLKPSETLVKEFSRAVLRQILMLERLGKQTTFQWKSVYKQTRLNLMAPPSEVVWGTVARELKTDQLRLFMVP